MVDQCQGKTKAGNRCKRSASAGSLYCSTHADQAREQAPDNDTPDALGETPGKEDSIDTLVAAAVLGVAIVVVVTIGRLFRLR